MMIRTTIFNHLIFIVISISCFPHVFEGGNAKKCGGCETTTADGKTTNSGDGLVTFSAIVDSKIPPVTVSPQGGLTKAWKSINPDVKTDKDVIQKGRNFLAYLKRRYNVDMSDLTDTQLLMGSPTTSSNLTFMGYIFASDLRVVTETNPTYRTTYYRNTFFDCIGYGITATEDTFLDGGEWTGMMKKDSIIFEDNCVIDSKECDFDDDPHFISLRSLDVHPPKFYKGEFTKVRTIEAEIESSKYGHGLLYGADIHDVFVFSFTCVFL
ncbi:unnamed protein product [Owenia fusiformis]|uniref:Uncharacterized protein n=1 Tax=Owenia fusiformis TaxID=6347 RepID=A0A8S4NKC1_OWEFU|nr:unnamed protein product [Owenia fusiformis]